MIIFLLSFALSFSACEEEGGFFLGGNLFPPDLSLGGNGNPPPVEPGEIIASFPPDGAIDARQPFEIDGGEAQGWQEIELTFSGDPSQLTPDQFEITVTGGQEDIPLITEILVLSEDTIQLILNKPIEFFAWTQFEHIPSGTGITLGFLPADVDGNARIRSTDVVVWVDDFNIFHELPLYSADMDRNGAVEFDDIYRLLDLLTGVGAYPKFGATELPVLD